MADLSQVYDALRQATAAGDNESAQKLADYIRAQSGPSGQPVASRVRNFDSDGKGGVVPTGSPAAAALRDPTSGMSTTEKFVAGAGKAPVDLARGVGQMLGLESRQDVADSRAQDAPLMANGSAKWGNLAGNIATLAPAMLIPGANTLAGAAAIGAGSGVLAPSTSTGETIANTALGGAMGPAGLLVGRGAVALAKGAKAALYDPFFFKSGRDAIAARAMQSMAGTPQEAAAAAARLSNPPTVLPGVQPTAAELADNAGLAQLERVLRNNPEHIQAFTARDQANRSAMVSALQDIAGTPADRAAATAARATDTAPLYDVAGKAAVPVDDDLQALLQRPSMQKAVSRAQALASEKGDGPVILPQINDESVSVPAVIPGKSIQYLKMGLNDIADTGEQKGMGAHEMRAVKSTLSGLNDWIANNAPALKTADTAYEELSRPINRMDIGQQLTDKTLPALADFGNETRVNPNNFAQAVSRTGDALASRVSGNPKATLGSVLEPHEVQILQQIGQQFARRVSAQDLGRAVGSNTGQNLVGQSFLSQTLDPLGASNNMLARTARGLLGTKLGGFANNALYGEAEREVTRRLAQAYLDPKTAAGLLSMPLATGTSAVPRIPYLGAATVGATRGLLGSEQQ